MRSKTKLTTPLLSNLLLAGALTFGGAGMALAHSLPTDTSIDSAAAGESVSNHGMTPKAQVTESRPTGDLDRSDKSEIDPSSVSVDSAKPGNAGSNHGMEITRGPNG